MLHATLDQWANADVEMESVIKETDEELVLEVREGLGVIAAIKPWNFPPLMAMWSIGEGIV